MAEKDYHDCPLYEVNWKVYVDLQIAAVRQEVATLHETHARDRSTAQTAIEKLDEENGRRFDSLRTRLDGIADKQTPREVYETQHEDLRRRVEILTTSLSSRVGETTGARATLAIGLSLAVIVITMVTFILDKVFNN